MGGVRHAADMKTSEMDMRGHGVLSRQTGIVSLEAQHQLSLLSHKTIIG